MDAVAEVEGLRGSVEGAVKAALGDQLRRQESATDGDAASVHGDVDLDPAGPVDRPHLQITTDSYIDKSNYRNTAFRKERRPASDAARSSEAPAAGGSDGAKSETSDRKSVVEGKSGSVSVDLGGRRLIKQKKQKKKNKK